MSLLGKPLSDISLTLLPLKVVLSREGDDGLIGALALAQIALDLIEILNGALDAASHHHGASLATDLAGGNYLLMEVVDHDFRFQADRMVMALDVAAQLLVRLFRIESSSIFLASL